jgi:flagellar biosynthesis activator protein FlaF
MSIDAYRRTLKVAETPRATEYRIFAQVTASLMKARDEKSSGAPLVEALDWNRRLWSTLSTDCGMSGNGLPDGLRAQIISLGLWVSRYSTDVATGKADIDALIDVNKAIMEGLSQQAALAAQAPAQTAAASA